MFAFSWPKQAPALKSESARVNPNSFVFMIAIERCSSGAVKSIRPANASHFKLWRRHRLALLRRGGCALLTATRRRCNRPDPSYSIVVLNLLPPRFLCDFTIPCRADGTFLEARRNEADYQAYVRWLSDYQHTVELPLSEEQQDSELGPDEREVEDPSRNFSIVQKPFTTGSSVNTGRKRHSPGNGATPTCLTVHCFPGHFTKFRRPQSAILRWTFSSPTSTKVRAN